MKRPTTMKTLQTLLALAALSLLSSCVTPIVTRNNQAKIIPQGQAEDYPEPGQTVEWTGGKNEKGYAHGPGTETWFGPDGNKVREVVLTYQNGTKNGPFTFRSFAGGKLQYEETGKYANNTTVGVYNKRIFQISSPDDYIEIDDVRTPSGLYHGERVVRKLNGERIVEQWYVGNIQSSITYNRDGTVKQEPVQQQTVPSSSSSDDDDFLGAFLGVAGAAAGNADLAMSGVALMAGDKGGAMNHLGNFATSTPGSTSSISPGSAGAIRSVSSQSRNVSGRNLVDQYGLGKYRNQHDHISHYLASADEAYARYKQTGDSAYYDQHREYADLAKEVHQQTATKGTKLSR